MRYWDSSALLPLVVLERTSGTMQELLTVDRDVLTWWGSRIEAASALSRLGREGAMEGGRLEVAFARMNALARTWDEVLPTDSVRDQAIRLLRVHPLRGADALQLAAAVVAAEHQPSTLPLVTLDHRLREAALREGFAVLPAATDT
ncbi:MAG: type II toxin-antitoxin system VapC family toxin [Gemmatimonadales bacterium]|nr:type II toxin-antitoxin system VapC family toxin [Gemmatimonadales bacterium]